MRPRLLQWLVCPLCKGRLDLHEAESSDRTVCEDELNVLNRIHPFVEAHEVCCDVVTGAVCCGSCKVYYPIVNSVPRMLTFSTGVARDFAKRFGNWIAGNLVGYDLPDNPSNPGESLVLRNFSTEWLNYKWNDVTYWDMSPQKVLACKRYELGIPKHSLSKKLALEVGIGIGGTANMLSESQKCEIVGIDLGYSVDRAEALFKSNPLLHIVQASVFAPPFRPASFDCVYSHGVLHHTHDTRKAFDAIAGLPNVGGMLYVWLYSHHQERETPLRRLLMLVEKLVRSPLSKMPSRLQTAFLTPIVPLYVLYHNFYRRPRLGAGTPSYGWNEALHAARDRLTPPFAHRHSYEEVANWFSESGFKGLEFLRDEKPPQGVSDAYAINVGIRGFRNP